MSDQVSRPVCVATSVKPLTQLHQEIYDWAVTDSGLNPAGSPESSKRTVENFRTQWYEGNFENCYVILTRFMKSPYFDFDADLIRANEWKRWVNSIRSGDFVPA